MALNTFFKEFPPNSDEARLKDEVRQLVEEHDVSHLESALKTEMDNLKKRQKYANELAKQKRSIEQTISELSEELKHLKNVRTKKEEACRELDEFTKRKRQMNEKIKLELPEMRLASKKTFYERLKQAEETFDEKRKDIAKQKEENDALAVVVESLQNEYESMHTQINVERKEKLEKINSILATNQSFASKVDDLHVRLQVVVREKSTLQSSIIALKEQLAVYEAQYEHLNSSSMKPEDIQRLLDKQKVDSEAQMERIQQEKTEALNLRGKLEKELAELRTRHVSLKKEIPDLERAKVTAEKKCRKAQEHLQKVSQNTP
ncbi:unnamed protein product [Phytomonas sp. EM1]|nr:unnamed protein product [Phytomonas sp. EM1]|eukprot:CCW64111.1 unnamed protein product [Phytomonas sp. isolate EM1]